MGLLSEGSPLSWAQTKALADHVRKHGVRQFINQFHKLKDRQGDWLKFGDEIEYMLVAFNEAEKKAQLALLADDLLPDLQERERSNPGDTRTLWRPEYASYMVEGTPGQPYSHSLSCFNTVEANMKRRRNEVKKLLQSKANGLKIVPLSLTAFPRLGCEDFTVPRYAPSTTSGASHSMFVPDEVIYQGHPRFSALTRNIRERRGKKVIINSPVFRDRLTPQPYVEDLSADASGESQAAAKPEHVYMDCMAFGMGQCCLQTTFQAVNIEEARVLYDQLLPLCPILLALTAASPVQRGVLVDTDCRWNIISGSVDCRTDAELGLEPGPPGGYIIPKSRYASVSCYLSEAGRACSDLELVYDREIYQTMLNAGIDDLLSKHVAHLFIRDSMSLFSEKVDQNDEQDTDHFENINSTNWQTMRFKLPPPNSPIGWRVEFRPCEVQLTDFENAAVVTFIVLLTRVILSYKLNFIMPLSMVDENMARAETRDAVMQQKFFFKADPTEGSRCSSLSGVERCETEQEQCGCSVKQLRVAEIVNGKEGVYPGLVPLIEMYLDSAEVDVDTRCTISQYLSLISKRASGELITTATWIREFIAAHPDYKQDSQVSDSVTYDLLRVASDISDGLERPERLLPVMHSKTSESIPAAVVQRM